MAVHWRWPRDMCVVFVLYIGTAYLGSRRACVCLSRAANAMKVQCRSSPIPIPPNARRQQRNNKEHAPNSPYHPTAAPVRRWRSASQADGQLVPNASTRVPPRVTSWLPLCSPASATPTPPRGRRHAGWTSSRTANWCSKRRRKARQWHWGTSLNVVHGSPTGGDAPAAASAGAAKAGAEDAPGADAGVAPPDGGHGCCRWGADSRPDACRAPTLRPRSWPDVVTTRRGAADCGAAAENCWPGFPSAPPPCLGALDTPPRRACCCCCW